MNIALAVLALVLLVLAMAAIIKRLPSGPPLTPQEEAKRLARLLVSENMLYNSDLVELGKAERRVHPDLIPDLQRARAMFDERVPPEDRADHFEQSVRDLLVGGDTSVPITLG